MSERITVASGAASGFSLCPENCIRRVYIYSCLYQCLYLFSSEFFGKRLTAHWCLKNQLPPRDITGLMCDTSSKMLQLHVIRSLSRLGMMHGSDIGFDTRRRPVCRIFTRQLQTHQSPSALPDPLVDASILTRCAARQLWIYILIKSPKFVRWFTAHTVEQNIRKLIKEQIRLL